MRTTGKRQVLTTGRVDYNGNQIPPGVIEWEDYDKNPVLLYDEDCEGHGGVVIGKVKNINRIGDGFSGELFFMERNKDADIAYEKYSQEVLQFVSIGGFAVGEEKEGIFVALRYRPREFSLVKFPANIDAKQIDASELNVDEKKVVDSLSQTGMQVRYLTMGCEFANLSKDVPLKNRKNMNVNERAATVVEPETVVEAAATEPAATEPETVVEVAATEPETVVEAAATEPETVVEAAATEPETVVEAAATEPGKVIEAASNIPNGMAWLDKSSNVKQNFTMKEFKELKCDADFNRRMMALNSAYRMGSATADSTPENVETVKVLAASMLLDEKLVLLANATNVTDGVTHQRKNGLQILVECAAGGAAAATLAAADLGVIKYLSLIYEQLLANDTFRRSLRFVPMTDRTGAIYIESGINVPTSVGNVTPINTQRYMYDDIKRTIARKVFTFAPITFQHADMAVLAYDKQSLGISEAMDRTMVDISTYWLQVIANTPSIQKVSTSGEATMTTKGMFPLEAPLSDLNVKKMVLDDIIALEGAFLMQNYRLDNKKVELVLPSRMYSALASDRDARNQLTRELNANLGAYINFSATRVTSRNPVARYNTTSAAPELDPSMYADNNVSDAGESTPITPAVTTAKHVGAGVAFVENEVIAGIGAIELIVMPDPLNYGTTLSGWVSTGCTVARQNGVGAALVTPTVVTTP